LCFPSAPPPDPLLLGHHPDKQQQEQQKEQQQTEQWLEKLRELGEHELHAGRKSLL
jgi:hypothetical protein